MRTPRIFDASSRPMVLPRPDSVVIVLVPGDVATTRSPNERMGVGAFALIVVVVILGVVFGSYASTYNK